MTYDRMIPLKITIKPRLDKAKMMGKAKVFRDDNAWKDVFVDPDKTNKEQEKNY